jgi:tetratricopeptide (TPR) repeat protein
MYLHGSKWTMRRRRRRPSNPFWILTLLVLIAGAWYFNKKVVPTIPPLFESSPTPTRSPESFINEADEYFKAGKLSQAITSYEGAIRSDPTNPSIYIAKARVQVFAGRYEDALETTGNALILNPNNSMAYAVKGWTLDFLRDYLPAEAAVKKAIELDPNNALAYAYYAEILLDRGIYEDQEKAIEMSRKARDLAPNTLETHRIRGYVFWATTNYEEALQEYKAALAINDKLWDLHYSLGVVYRDMGTYDQAEQEFIQASSLNPTNPDILTEASRMNITAGQYGKAVQYAEQALKIDPSNPRLHGNLGFALYKNRQYENAVSQFALAIQGGTTAEGVVVKGLPLASGRVADEYYSYYGLALAKLNRCNDAVPIFQLILQNIAEDQNAYANAQEGIQACQEDSGGS